MTKLLPIPNIYIQNATVTYQGAPLFSALNLHLKAGKWVALIGQSGIGKSSLLRMIAGLIPPEKSTEIVADNSIPVSQQIAYMAQTDMLLPWLNVFGNVTLSLKLRPHSKIESKNLRDQAESFLKKVGLTQAMNLYPHQLSGGMRQRVALVRTLMEDKPIVLMDEPFSAVDAITRYKLQELAADLLRDKTVLFVTHDPSEAIRLAHEVFLMQGKPALLNQIFSLTSETPRKLDDPALIRLQSVILSKLEQQIGES